MQCRKGKKRYDGPLGFVPYRNLQNCKATEKDAVSVMAPTSNDKSSMHVVGKT
jgi:hypothetical protein